MTSDVSLSTALNQQQKTSNSTTQLAEDFTQFLTLLTTQLQHQDPLNPTDTTEFTNQLVAFTGVEQQINTNQKLDSLVAMNLSSGFSTALNYVGLNVSYVSSEFHFDGKVQNKITYALDEPGSSAKINVLDETGNIVYSEEVSAAAGPHEFFWDGTLDLGGTAEPGTYRIQIDALSAENKPIESTVVVSGHVRGIERQNGQTFVLVGDRAVAAGQIINASEPPAVVQTEDNTENTGDTGETGDGSEDQEEETS